MSDRAEELLAAVFAAPDDDAPRLVYADYLLEQGDPRGEFIQLQCALGRPLVGAGGYSLARHPDAKSPPNRETLEKREKALLSKHQKEWLRPIRSFIRTWHFRRGFVEKVEADGRKFLEGAHEVVRHEPLVHAELTGFKTADLDLLLTTEALKSLRVLSIGQQRINAKNARYLSSPQFVNLVGLDLWGNPLGPEGIKTIAATTHYESLKRLKVAHVDMMLEGMEALAQASFFPQLEDLDLGIGYDPEGAKALGPHAARALLNGTSLRVLELSGCRIGDEGIEILAGSDALASLEDLSLFANNVTERGIEALCQSPRLPKLKHVRGLIGYHNGVEEDSRAAKMLIERFGPV